jgi:hypothetical protein
MVNEFSRGDRLRLLGTGAVARDACEVRAAHYQDMRLAIHR